ncbi:fungal hydrophobin [Xylariaceae sp. FL0255]|nr:fungal hydrophobin [Xylariaceae sp. FL0255]
MQLPTSLLFVSLLASSAVANMALPNIPKRFDTKVVRTYSATPTTTSGSKPTGSGYDPCSGLYGEAQCCSTDALGVADLDCASPTAVPTSPTSFAAICAESGQTARCCVLPVLGQAVLCDTPVGL